MKTKAEGNFVLMLRLAPLSVGIWILQPLPAQIISSILFYIFSYKKWLSRYNLIHFKTCSCSCSCSGWFGLDC